MTPKPSPARRRRAHRRKVGRAPGYRDAESIEPREVGAALEGQMYVAAIGIDRYREHQRLQNAVSDARGAREAFLNLGFQEVVEPLLDEAATHAALHRLVTEGLRRLDKHDSLVLFFAGHGRTEITEYADGFPSRRGYILPCDAAEGRPDTWLNLRSWLSEVAHLPPRHILVILDSCHSGIALDQVVSRWRGGSAPPGEPMQTLRDRRSRRVITSALGDQRALDDGPLAAHSLFTGCLLEVLSGPSSTEARPSLLTGAEIGIHVRRRVAEHAGTDQTPDFGELELHDGGELIVRLPGLERPKPPRPRPSRGKSGPRGKGRKGTSQHGRAPRRPPLPDPDRVVEVVPDPDAPPLDPAFVAALDRHAAERARGARVLTVVAGEAMVTLTGWAAWAAGRGYLTLATEGGGLDAVIADLLAQMPLLRCVAAARLRLARAAGLDVAAIDAALDARWGRERGAWIEDVAALDRHALVSGWLLSALREPRARVPELTTAPVQGGELLSILCRLAAPIAALIHHPAPSAPWLERAIATAAALSSDLPDHAVAVGAPAELVAQVLGEDRQSASLSMARQGVVSIAPRAEGSVVRVRSRAARVLHEALARDTRTAGRFALNAPVPFHEGGPSIEVDLVAASARLAIEIDGWYHFRDPQGYRAARITDLRLQRAGFFVLRFAAEDVGSRLALIVDEIAVALRGRRASTPAHGGS